MSENIIGIFIDYNIVLDKRTSHYHLVGICKTGQRDHALLISGPIVHIAHGQNTVKTVDGIYYTNSMDERDFYIRLLNAIHPSSIQSSRFISNCSLLLH